MEKCKGLFLNVYRATRSVEVAMLELQRKGCSQQQTAETIAQVFGIDLTVAQQAVGQSLAWQPGDEQSPLAGDFLSISGQASGRQPK